MTGEVDVAKKDEQPKSEGNLLNGPMRIGYVSDGQVAVDYPAEVRGTAHQVVILTFDRNGLPNGWEEISDLAAWAVTEASDEDYEWLKLKVHPFDDMRGTDVVRRLGLPPAEATDVPPTVSELLNVVEVEREVESEELTEAKKRLRDIDLQIEVVDKAKVGYLKAKREAKLAKESWEASRDELEEIIKASKEDMPLFDSPAPRDEASSDEGPAEKSEPIIDDEWKSVPTEMLELSASIRGKLAEAGITTVGQLAAWTMGGKKITDIPGIGPAAEDEIDNATAQFWLKRSQDGRAA